MLRQLSLLFGSTALAATLSLTAAAQEYSNGGAGGHGRGPAILTPVEDYGVHPPGVTAPGVFHRKRSTYVPYYAPLSPTPTFARWRPTCYFPLMPYYTPYYTGYCPHRLFSPEPPPYGFDGGWGWGPRPGCDANGSGGSKLGSYGPYTSVLRDDTIFWNMGGNGLVPYGAPRPPHVGPPDLVDMIQGSRQNGGGSCSPSAGGAPVAALSGGAAPAILSPVEKLDEKEGGMGDKERKTSAPALTLPAEVPWAEAPPQEKKPVPPE
jgi:hypothetical protein